MVIYTRPDSGPCFVHEAVNLFLPCSCGGQTLLPAPLDKCAHSCCGTLEWDSHSWMSHCPPVPWASHLCQLYFSQSSQRQGWGLTETLQHLGITGNPPCPRLELWGLPCSRGSQQPHTGHSFAPQSAPGTSLHREGQDIELSPSRYKPENCHIWIVTFKVQATELSPSRYKSHQGRAAGRLRWPPSVAVTQTLGLVTHLLSQRDASENTKKPVPLNRGKKLIIIWYHLFLSLKCSASPRPPLLSPPGNQDS